MSILFGLMMLNAGLNKFFNYIPVPEGLPDDIMKDNEALMEISWLLPLIATAETLDALLIIFPKTRALGALVLFPVMVGILLTHTIVAPEGLVMTLVMLAIFSWIIYDNRHRYFPLVG